MHPSKFNCPNRFHIIKLPNTLDLYRLTLASSLHDLSSGIQSGMFLVSLLKSFGFKIC